MGSFSASTMTTESKWRARTTLERRPAILRAVVSATSPREGEGRDLRSSANDSGACDLGALVRSERGISEVGESGRRGYDARKDDSRPEQADAEKKGEKGG